MKENRCKTLYVLCGVFALFIFYQSIFIIWLSVLKIVKWYQREMSNTKAKSELASNRKNLHRQSVPIQNLYHYNQVTGVEVEKNAY